MFGPLRRAGQIAAATGARLGGTGMSNPMKAYAGIEPLLLKARRVDGGWCINGTLPWVSNLGPDHYFGAIAAVQVDGACAGRELMFMLRCDAPGVTLRACPEFSGMEGTGTYSVHCKDLFVGSDDVVADPAKPYIARIRGGFVLLQCGIALSARRWRTRRYCLSCHIAHAKGERYRYHTPHGRL